MSVKFSQDKLRAYKIVEEDHKLSIPVNLVLRRSLLPELNFLKLGMSSRIVCIDPVV